MSGLLPLGSFASRSLTNVNPLVRLGLVHGEAADELERIIEKVP